MIRNHLIAALRNLEHNKLQSIISIFSLTVGYVCFLLIFIWVRDELSFDRFHQNREELYQLTILHEKGILDPNVPYFLPYAMAERYPEIVNYTRIYNMSHVTNCQFSYQEEKGEPVMFNEENVIMVDTGFFSMFSFPFIYGNRQTALSGRDVVVLSRSTAAKYFGRENPVGKVLTLNNQLPVEVTGVVDIPGNSNIMFDFVLPLRSNMSQDMNWRDPSYIMLNKSISYEIFREKIAEALNELAPRPFPWKLKLDIMPLTKSHLSFDKLKYVNIFSVIAIFILLIACINYIILSTCRSVKRTREISLRKVVGGHRMQLIAQLLTESVLLSFISIFLSLIIIESILPVFNNFTEKDLRIGYIEHPQILLLIFLIPIITGILSGIYPALSFTGRSPLVALHAAVRARNHRSPFRIASVVTQFAISMFLLVCTLFVIKQLNFFQKQPLGFKTDYIVQIPVNSALLGSLESYLETLLQHPDIVSATAGQAVPFNEDFKTGLDWAGKDPGFEPVVRYSITLPNYIETFKMDIIEGRSFSNDLTTDISNFVVNEKAVKYMNMENPLGKKLTFWGREGEIIGVVKDFHHVSLHREILPHVFTIHPANYRGLKQVFVKINPANIRETIDYIETTTQNFAPDFPFEFNFIDEGIGKLYKTEQKLGVLITWFSIISILISCLGIFGLTVFMSEQRTKEIAIRKVNGAVFQHLLILLNKDLINWILLALIIASPVAFYSMHRWLQNFAYRIEISFGLFILAGLTVLLIAVITASSVLIRAANRNPVESLKSE